MVSVRRVAPVLLLLVALPMLAQQRSSSRPPRDLHRVGDHWTAYNPPDPATYPADARTHVIKSGDTLWALAQQYYGNAYLWPQLWESNTWITDAHWIYPGDVLLVEGEVSAAASASGTGDTVIAGGTTAEPELPAGGSTAVIAPSSPPVPIGTESDIYCYGYIGEPNEPMPNYFESIEDVEVMYLPRANFDEGSSVATGEMIYINGGLATGLIPGETYMAVEPGELVYHPVTKELIGQHYNYQGQIRILCAEDKQARAIVTQACREINVGARLKPMPQLPIPIARVPELAEWCDPPSGRTAGYIIDSLDWDLGLAEGNLVQINLGRDNQVQPGDFLTVFRDSPYPGQPRQVLGEIGILTTEARTATAKVVQIRRTIQIGDGVELR
jgi:hypothetical protein